MRMQQSGVGVWLVALATGLLATSAMAIVNGSPPAVDDYRYDAIGAFSFTNWLNGVQQSDNWYGGATLIAPDKIVTARHNLNGETTTFSDYSVRFRRQLNGSVQCTSKSITWPPSVSYPFSVRVKQWVLAPNGSDIAIGILETPVTHITPIRANLNLPATGQSLILGGWGSESLTAGASDPRNKLNICNSQITYCSSSSVSFPAFTATTPGVNMHDSGGAILTVNANGQLEYRGLITYYSGGTGLNQFAGTDFGNLLVPEPATIVILLCGLVSLSRIRRPVM